MPAKQPMTKKCGPTDWQYDWIRAGRIKSAIAHFFFGLRSEIPWCCSLEWSLRHVIGQRLITEIVGCQKNKGCTSDFVHCAYHRHKFHPRRS